MYWSFNYDTQEKVHEMKYRFTGTSHHNKILEMVKYSDLLPWQHGHAYTYLMMEVHKISFHQVAEALDEKLKQVFLKYNQLEKLRIEDMRFRTETSRMRDELRGIKANAI